MLKARGAPVQSGAARDSPFRGRESKQCCGWLKLIRLLSRLVGNSDSAVVGGFVPLNPGGKSVSVEAFMQLQISLGLRRNRHAFGLRGFPLPVGLCLLT